MKISPACVSSPTKGMYKPSCWSIEKMATIERIAGKTLRIKIAIINWRRALKRKRERVYPAKQVMNTVISVVMVAIFNELSSHVR